MNTLLILFPPCMSLLWLVLFFVFKDDDRSDTALISANIWGCASVLIGVLR
jgi:hypothetical protein